MSEQALSNDRSNDDHAAHRESPGERAQRRRDALSSTVETLEVVLAEASLPGEREWLEHSAQALETVRHALRSHAGGIEERERLFEEIESVEPRLAGRVDAVRNEHAALISRVAALADAFSARGKPNVGRLRRETTDLLDDLRYHISTEADLTFEAFWTQLGGGD